MMPSLFILFWEIAIPINGSDSFQLLICGTFTKSAYKTLSMKNIED